MAHNVQRITLLVADVRPRVYIMARQQHPRSIQEGLWPFECAAAPENLGHSVKDDGWVVKGSERKGACGDRKMNGGTGGRKELLHLSEYLRGDERPRATVKLAAVSIVKCGEGGEGLKCEVDLAAL